MVLTLGTHGLTVNGRGKWYKLWNVLGASQFSIEEKMPSFYCYINIFIISKSFPLFLLFC